MSPCKQQNMNLMLIFVSMERQQQRKYRPEPCHPVWNPLI